MGSGRSPVAADRMEPQPRSTTAGRRPIGTGLVRGRSAPAAAPGEKLSGDPFVRRLVPSAAGAMQTLGAASGQACPGGGLQGVQGGGAGPGGAGAGAGGAGGGGAGGRAQI